MDKSFTLDEEMELEMVAKTPNVDDNTVCSCQGLCLRGAGRNACPCKSIEQFCTTACHMQNEETMCMNLQRFLESNSSESDSQEDLDTSFHIVDPATDELESGQGSGERPPIHKGRGRGRRGARSRGMRGTREGRGERGRVQGRGIRGRGVHGRGVRARGRGRRGRGIGRGQLIAEDDAQQRMDDQEQQLQHLVSQLNADALRQLVVELLRRQPAVLADLINGEMAVYRENVVTLPPVSNAQPPDEVQQAPADAQPPPDDVEQQPADAEQQPADAHPPLMPMKAVQAEIRPPDWCY